MTGASAFAGRLPGPLLELRGVVKEYPGVRAVDHVSLAANRGEIIGLVGKNGAGKSTVIKILAGVVAPDEGQLLLDGEPLELATPHDATLRGLMFVHQELAIVPDLSVAENVELGLGYPRKAGLFIDFRALRERSKEVLDQLHGVGIDPAAPIGSLSVAEQRLCMIARALVVEARVVVLDEPSASLSDTEVEHLLRILRGLRDRGVLVIYVSHRLEEVMALTDRIVVMRDGAVVDDRPTAQFDERTLIEEITGTTAAATALERRQLRGIGGPPSDRVVLEVEDLEVAGGQAGVSFDLHEGEVLGIAGLVGAGRTELMRAMFGADPKQGGRITVAGREVTIRRPKDAIAAGLILLPEDRRHHGLILEFSVRHNLTLGTLGRHRVHRRVPIPSHRQERVAAQHSIDSLSIKSAAQHTPAGWLSGGNQQKLILGRWFDSGATIFIFDEPTHGIDVGAKEEVYRLIEGLAAGGKSVIFISSEFPEMVGICHRVVVLREGRFAGELTGDEITERAILDRCYGRGDTDPSAGLYLAAETDAESP
jgi:ABC-type sugar transport system ATPase subunit